MGHPASAQAGTKRRDVDLVMLNSDTEESAEYTQLLLQDETLARQTSVEMIEDEIAAQQFILLTYVAVEKPVHNKADLENKYNNNVNLQVIVWS